jgi:formylmethanofuran dehydrogenase subunit E
MLNEPQNHIWCMVAAQQARSGAAASRAARLATRCNHAHAGTTAHVLEPDSAIYVLEPIVGSPITAANKATAYFECAKCGGYITTGPRLTAIPAGPIPDRPST